MYSTIPFALFFSIISTLIMIKTCSADHDNLHDTCPAASADQEKQTIFINGLPCKNPSTITPQDFKSTKLTQPGDTDNFSRSATKIVTASDFPGLNTLGLSIGRTDLEVDGTVMPHSHPRASEMFFVEKGTVIAGFIDTNNNVFESVLKAGDVFVFPRGLLHFCFNQGFNVATAYSVLNSQNPGVASISGALFKPDRSVETVNKLAKSLVSFSRHEALENHYLSENVTLDKFSSV